MKHFPIILLYLAVPVLGLIGLSEFTRHDRNDLLLNRSLESATKRSAAQLKENVQSLRQDFNQQIEASGAQVASLRGQLDSALAAANALQQEVNTLHTKLGAEVAARGKELELHADQVAGLAADVTETRKEFEPLHHELQETARQFAAAIERERDAREQLSLQYDCAIAEQGDLLEILQQLADATRARAAAQQQIAEQAAAEAASLDRLAQRATQTKSGLAVEHDEVLHVAQAVPHDDATSLTPADLEAAEVAVEYSDEDTTAEESVPELD